MTFPADGAGSRSCVHFIVIIALNRDLIVTHFVHWELKPYQQLSTFHGIKIITIVLNIYLGINVK